MAYNDEANQPYYLPPDDGLQRQTDGKGVAFAVAFARIPAHEADNHAAGLAQPVAFCPAAIFNNRPLTVKPWLSLLTFVQFAVRFLPDYIASY